MARLAREIPIEKIIDRQVELGQQLHKRIHRQTEPREHPTLSISRETGCGVDEVIDEINHILGWQVYNKNIVDRIASDAKLNQKLVESLDERTRDELKDWIKAVFQNQVIGSDKYIRHLSEIILSIAKSGKAIIVGRGANFILPKGQTLNVRLIAPLQHRIYYMADKLNCGYNQAKNIVVASDTERQAFLHKFFNNDEFDPLNYDLIINTGNVTYKTAANIIIKAMCLKFDITLETLKAPQTL